MKQVIFEKDVSEFTLVAVEVCHLLECSATMERKDFLDRSLKLLPLLYLKATLLPKCEYRGDEELETYVTEPIYEELRTNLAQLMGGKDDYLEVFLPEMVYSDQPLKRCISEELADIYQDLKNYVFVFSLGLNQTMHESLALCAENFALIWGQKLVNTLRALHDARYNIDVEEEYELDEMNEET